MNPLSKNPIFLLEDNDRLNILLNRLKVLRSKYVGATRTWGRINNTIRFIEDMIFVSKALNSEELIYDKDECVFDKP
jgi:hypothetical protein